MLCAPEKPCCPACSAVPGAARSFAFATAQTHRYECVGAFNQLAAARCITFGGMRIDRVLAEEVLQRLQPLGVEAALAAIEACSQQRSEKKG